MKKVFSILFSLLLLTYISCKKNTIVLSDADYLIFGHFHGFCTGEKCIEIFRLEKDKLFEDTKDLYPSSTEFYNGNYIELSHQKYANTKDLVNYFPNDLLNEAKTIIGMPDGGDWGGFYIEYNYNGVRKFWLLDKMKFNVPTKYHGFIDSLNSKISQLQ